ncbi:hypothetical protein [Sphaerisporangium perillae]|uniref:hypothetical protein n=1 Tax=Sphaerisporangium perillae TaxID=2935860 RepID=UPI00200D0B89|nr:hypothetical protein [Sphaerisporangium perillae]
MVRPRLVAFVAAGATVIAGLGIRAAFDGSVAKYAGDLLYRTVGQCSGVHAGGEGPRGSAR